MEVATTIHLHVLIGDRWCIACQPSWVKLGASLAFNNQQMTGDPRAATCAACKGTQVFKTALGKVAR